jgi:hypothetical protein
MYSSCVVWLYWLDGKGGQKVSAQGLKNMQIWALEIFQEDSKMARGRASQKKKMKSTKRNRYTMEERHRLGFSATARAAAKRALKNSNANPA